MSAEHWALQAQARAGVDEVKGNEWYDIVMGVPEGNREATYRALLKREGLANETVDGQVNKVQPQTTVSQRPEQNRCDRNGRVEGGSTRSDTRSCQGHHIQRRGPTKSPAHPLNSICPNHVHELCLFAQLSMALSPRYCSLRVGGGRRAASLGRGKSQREAGQGGKGLPAPQYPFALLAIAPPQRCPPAAASAMHALHPSLVS